MPIGAIQIVVFTFPCGSATLAGPQPNGRGPSLPVARTFHDQEKTPAARPTFRVAGMFKFLTSTQTSKDFVAFSIIAPISAPQDSSPPPHSSESREPDQDRRLLASLSEVNMLRYVTVLGFLALALTVSACARLEIRELSTAKPYSEGVRFYRPWPYVLVSSEKDACKHTIVYLPDREVEYVFRTVSGYGTVDTKATFENGWNLTSLGDARDSKIPETITAVAGLVAATIPKADVPAPPCKPGLFKMAYHAPSGTWKLP